MSASRDAPDLSPDEREALEVVAESDLPAAAVATALLDAVDEHDPGG